MDLDCYLHDGWKPRIRAADHRRTWMDDSPESFAYRCLPLNIANGHGWEILSPCGFEAEWNGGQRAEDVTIRIDAGRIDAGTVPHDAPVALFGMGTVTFHIAGLFRTSPGWNLWLGGPPNSAKDGLAPLGGIIETDWSPYSFTMNWRFTRPGHAVRFEENEPFALFFPIQRNGIDQLQPWFRPLADDPELQAQFAMWSQSRDAFHTRMRDHPPANPSDKWQKLYYRGVNADGRTCVSDHKSKLRLKEFANPWGDIPESKPPQAPAPPAPNPPLPTAQSRSLAKRDWLLAVLERQRALSAEASSIYRHTDTSAQEFLDQHYARNWPAILCGEMAGWPAIGKWTPDYLRARIGDRDIEYQGGRTGDPLFERAKDAHTQVAQFGDYLDCISDAAGGNDAYITAYNSGRNEAVFALLHDDLGFLDKFLTRAGHHPRGMMWVGPKGTFTPLHHDLTNNLLLQITGRKRVVLAAPGFTPRLYNDQAVFSQIADLENAEDVAHRFAQAAGIGAHIVELAPGEALFIPVGWWHQVTALDFSVSITHTNFIWPNDASLTYPG